MKQILKTQALILSFINNTGGFFVWPPAKIIFGRNYCLKQEKINKQIRLQNVMVNHYRIVSTEICPIIFGDGIACKMCVD